VGAELSFRLVENLVMLNRNLETVSRQLGMLDDLPALLKVLNGKIGSLSAPLSDVSAEIALMSRALEIMEENLPDGKVPKPADFFKAWTLANDEAAEAEEPEEEPGQEV
jgi:hypothetical protein